MAFTRKNLIGNRDQEDVIVAVLVTICIRAFEFIIKSLLTSSRHRTVKTGKFALEVAADQAFNPLNYFRWFRGKPDFASKEAAKDHRKPIPLSRATLAIIYAVLIIVVEAAFFYGQRPVTLDLYVDDFTLSVQTSSKHIERHVQRDICDGHVLETDRAQMTAVFALCNIFTKDQGPFQGDRIIQFRADSYSQRVTVVDEQNKTVGNSYTRFVLIVPDLNEHLVVPYNASNQLVENAAKEVTAELEARGCTVSGGAGGDYRAAGCTRSIDAHKLMQLTLGYISFNTTHGTVGHELNGQIVQEDKKIKLGTVERMRMRDVGVIGITGGLLLVSIVCHLFISNDSTEVIAAMMKEKTNQDFYIPAYAMNDESIHVVFASDESGHVEQRIVHADPGSTSTAAIE